jgi:hypothetical protein
MTSRSLRFAVSALASLAVSGAMLMACVGDDPATAGAADSSTPDAPARETSSGDPSDAGSPGDDATADAGPDAVAPTAWLTGLGGTFYDRTDAIVFDAAGNAYVSGHFSGSFKIGTTTVDASDAGATASYVAKFDPAGAVLWVKQIGPFAAGTSLQLDPSGNVFIGFNFTGTVSLGGQDLVSAGALDIGFAKLDPSTGNVLLAKRFGGTGIEVLNSLALSANAIVLGGHYTATVDFGLGSHSNVANSDGFILALDTSGAPVFDKVFGGPLDDDAFDLAIDSTGRIAATGRMSGSINFGGGVLTAAGGNDGYLVVYSATGTFVRAKIWGGTGYDDGTGVGFDGADDVYVAGDFNGSVDLGGGALLSAAQGSTFVFSQDNNGVHRWSKAFAGTDASFAGFEKPLAVNSAGDVVLTGTYKSSIDFGGGTLTSLGGYDVFLLKLTSLGAHVWSKSYGSTGDDDGNGAGIGPGGWVGLAGDFAATGTFGSSMLVSAGLNDGFVLTTQ